MQVLRLRQQDHGHQGRASARRHRAERGQRTRRAGARASRQWA